MGDRCYLEMTIRKADQEKWEQELGHSLEDEWGDVQENEDGFTLTLTYGEANYAWTDERTEWAKAGLEFQGFHSAGGNYGAYRFVAMAGEMIEVPEDRDGQMIVRIITKDYVFSVDEDDLAKVKRYLEMAKAFDESIKKC